MHELACAVGYEIHAEYIESDWRRVGLWRLSNMATSETAKHSALLVIDGGFCGNHVLSGAGFHLNEAEQGTIPSNQVHVAGHIA